MRANDGSRTAAEVLIDQLVIHGVRHAFCVPGESYIAALDAFHDSPIALTVCRHESGAGFMAVGDAKLTARPGVAFVSRGPGATNASIAVHVAEAAACGCDRSPASRSRTRGARSHDRYDPCRECRASCR